jgi:DNA repair protein RecO (recombination protein O)
VAHLRLKAVILRRIPYGDTSWILHVFTREEGTMGLLARGARRPGSPLAGALEPLGLSELEVSTKPGRDLQTLSQAQPLELRPGLRKDLAASAAGLVCAETVLRMVREPGEHAGVFDALEGALARLDRDGYDPRPLWHFLGRFCEEMGWALAVDHCAECGSESIPREPVLSIPHGGFLCRDCGIRSHQPPLDPIRAGALRDAASGREGDSATWERGECDAHEDVWFEHMFRHAHLRPRMESRQFLSEVRP